MLRNLNIAIIFLFLFFKSVFANENISKLNELYLNGILNKEVYLKSLNNLGVNTDNDIFRNLFELFNNKVLNEENYSSSLNNLITITSKNKSKIDEINNNNDLVLNTSSKAGVIEYKVSNCKGDSATCNSIKLQTVTFEFLDNKIQVTKKWLDELIKNEQSFIRVINTKTFNKKNETDIVISILHTQGPIIDFVFGGYTEENNFHMEDFKIKANGIENASGKLVLK
ncbi:hypothetical protein OAS25_02545 [Alphaproteobacteria bacterium]|nr:hypothetical protein [Alphaproteobacteria bacterium]